MGAFGRIKKKGRATPSPRVLSSPPSPLPPNPSTDYICEEVSFSDIPAYGTSKYEQTNKNGSYGRCGTVFEKICFRITVESIANTRDAGITWVFVFSFRSFAAFVPYTFRFFFFHTHTSARAYFIDYTSSSPRM